ncbi:MAG: hypothetical protein INR69_10880 [Mucilaginibacter polytrichastri]|nr:hypothetical protein [Mucilaginibacter polytrichastri]
MGKKGLGRARSAFSYQPVYGGKETQKSCADGKVSLMEKSMVKKAPTDALIMKDLLLSLQSLKLGQEV